MCYLWAVMNIGHEGFRKRYFHERAKIEAQVGNPIRREVSADTRARLVREGADENRQRQD